MRAVDPPLFRAAFAHGVLAGAHPSKPAEPAALSGLSNHDPAQVREWSAAGRVVARRVTTSTGVECWLAAELADQAAQAVAAEEAADQAAMARVMRAYHADRAREAARPPAEPWCMTPARAAALERYDRRLGRYYDRDTRGARTREQHRLNHLAAAKNRDQET